MNKEKINSKIEDLEAELAKLKKLANEPEQRTPEAGDVLERCGWTLLVDEDGGTTALRSPNNCRTVGDHSGYYEYLRDSENLGKFDEVYVKKSDVIEALSIEDLDGESVLSNWVCGNSYGINSSKEALAKLGITK